ncbi:MAG: hypothetical protein PSN34_11250 [Urechidicola sp.]|nr:hypothetical protein [Urechidicola sp.]
MKFKYVYIGLLLLFFSCSNPTNDAAFIDEVTGRYLFNHDSAIEVYFQENELFLKWNGAENIKPLKTDDSIFFVKEMNEKIQFLTNPEDGIMYICLVPKEDNIKITFNYKKIGDDEKLPSEYFEAKEYTKALEGYLAIKEKDSLNPIIEEVRINRWGYNEIRDKNYDDAVEIFAMNVAMYPNSSNVYDSYGEALFYTGDTVAAIKNFKKSLSMDSGNRNAKRYLERLEKKE